MIYHLGICVRIDFGRLQLDDADAQLPHMADDMCDELNNTAQELGNELSSRADRPWHAAGIQFSTDSPERVALNAIVAIMDNVIARHHAMNGRDDAPEPDVVVDQLFEAMVGSATDTDLASIYDLATRGCVEDAATTNNDDADAAVTDGEVPNAEA